jgi:hypothetical protein
MNQAETTFLSEATMNIVNTKSLWCVKCQAKTGHLISILRGAVICTQCWTERKGQPSEFIESEPVHSGGPERHLG